jgi:hypothetical protein
MKPIVILSKHGECLYGHHSLERIISTNEAEDCLVVRGIELELFLVYRRQFFSNHRAVQALHTAPVTLTLLQAVSRQLALTVQGVSNLKAIARGSEEA